MEGTRCGWYTDTSGSGASSDVKESILNTLSRVVIEALAWSG
jgi:hypothetical protein